MPDATPNLGLILSRYEGIGVCGSPLSPANEIPHASRYQFSRSENWIWREFSAELMFPKFEVP
jgi:hypothetical protein